VDGLAFSGLQVAPEIRVAFLDLVFWKTAVEQSELRLQPRKTIGIGLDHPMR
jgi:hypothetical protein